MPMIPAWGISLLIAGGGTGLQLLFAPRPPKQAPVDVGKFDDVRIQGADYGANIPRGWGFFRIAGNLVFSNGVQHYLIDEPTTGGKGVPQAPATRRHVYIASLGILVCRGPVIAYARTWEDADVTIGVANPNEIITIIEVENATYATLSGGASYATFDIYEFVHNLGLGGAITFNFTSITPPPNPYDPDDNAQPKTILEVFYKSPTTFPVEFTSNVGAGPTTRTVTLLSTGGEWTEEGMFFNDFLDSLVIGNATVNLIDLQIDYIVLTYYWQPAPVSLSVPYNAATVSGVINPNIAYPPNIDNPSGYYNADRESLKNPTTGTYSFETVPGDTTRWYTGTETQTQDPAIIEWLDARYGVGQGVLRTSAMRGLTYVMFQNKLLRQGRPPNFTFEMYAGPDDVNDILGDLCNDVGIASGDRDFTGTSGYTQVGFLESTNGSRAALFDQLQKYHLFRRAEIDGKIKTVAHSFTSIFTVNVNSLRAHSDGEEMPAFDAEVVCAEEHLLPREVRVSIMNPQRDYHNETAVAQLFTVPGTESRDYNFSIVDPLDTARLQAEKLLLKEHAESQAIEFSGMPELAKYSIGDVISVPINGVNVNIRIEKKQMTIPIGKIRIQGVTVNPFSPTYYQSDTTTTVNLPREAVAAFNYPRNSIVVVIQSVPIRDADKGRLGVYLAPCGRGLGSGENIAIHREFGAGNYIIQFVQDTPAQVGLCVGTLGTHGDITTEDTTNDLDIWFFDGVGLESVTADEITRYPTVNLLRVGNEWVQFRTATAQTLEDNSPYRSKWKVRNFMRGCFATESSKGTHGAGEYAVHATHALKFYDLEQEDIGETVRLKAVTGGQAVDNAPVSEFIFGGMAADNGKPDLVFVHYTNATTVGTLTEDLYIDVIDKGTLREDGYVLEAEYSGFFAANANTKRLVFEFAGTQLCDVSLTQNNTKWVLEVEIIRQSQTVVRCAGTLSYGSVGNVEVFNQDVSSLNLDLTDYDIKLRARTSTAGGDLTATTGYAKLYRSTGIVIITDEEGSDLTDESGATLIQ